MSKRFLTKKVPERSAFPGFLFLNKTIRRYVNYPDTEQNKPEFSIPDNLPTQQKKKKGQGGKQQTVFFRTEKADEQKHDTIDSEQCNFIKT